MICSDTVLGIYNISFNPIKEHYYPFLHVRKQGAEKPSDFVKFTKYMVEPEYKSRSSDPKTCALNGHSILP